MLHLHVPEESSLGLLVMHDLLLALVVRPVVQVDFDVVVVVVFVIVVGEVRYDVVVLAKTFHDALETFKQQFLADARMLFQIVSEMKSLLPAINITMLCNQFSCIRYPKS